MVLVAALMLLTACLLNKISGSPVNSLYLGLGVVLVIFSSAMLIFKKD